MQTDISVQTTDLAERYHRDGFAHPLDIISPAEAKVLRDDLEAAESELFEDNEKLTLLRSYPDRLLPSFDAIIRHKKLIEAVSQLLGPDLMVWSAALFIKEANSPHIVSWHQDLTYWGLDDAEETTCWLALSEASEQSGCMRFVPGSHKTQIVEHIDTFAADNLLSRGQEIAVEVNESDAVPVALLPGQSSMHHGQLFHASGPNTSDDRRIGMAIRYIKPSMRQNTGEKPLVALVSGEDRYSHFTIADSPSSRLSSADFELCRTDWALKQRLLYR
ncbi:MAG: phytanoyl-CoA dioxygenase family protein [Granulosicoccus sp.]